MERAGGGGAGVAGVPGAGDGSVAPTTPVAGVGAGAVKGRSCKGCLFYSSVLRSKARGPVCVGVTRAIPQVPDSMVGEIEMEAIQEGRNLSNFKYACAGYSIYLDEKENPTGKGERRAELPICVGVELLADRGSAKQVPAHPKKEATQAHGYKPGQRGEDFLTKFQRNAGLVANGVVRNLNRVGTYVKDSVGDILYPYRKRPK
ncbi:uncharacterized protein LOC100835389 [Brachypodium distachyon]|uniref:DUF8204 domain-containing protein n=1 Tax=Brachypodium distachyon TaxID=15368 RepID=I1GWZ9_BRADI|nr:uncharacterized protein LOC100835389 [Brachypodium distachyon]KQK17526.1 hypothetical protein BRADI_1g35060v3 [Brachypodium distachyon]|eukprot:XP_003563560.1 uncharacterized protein LOC100835389 [Brachypodium distachyon]